MASVAGTYLVTASVEVRAPGQGALQLLTTGVPVDGTATVTASGRRDESRHR